MTTEIQPSDPRTLITLPFLEGLKLNLSNVNSGRLFLGEFKCDLPVNLLRAFEDADFLNTEANGQLKRFIGDILKTRKKDMLIVRHNRRNNLGRFYADNGHSLINLTRHIKHSIFKWLDWVDVDMKKGHPTILYYIAKSYDIELPTFFEYLNNNTSVMNNIVDFYAPYGTCDEIGSRAIEVEDVKDFFNMVIYGGSYSTWLKQLRDNNVNISNDVPHKTFIDFAKECNNLRKAIVDNNRELKIYLKNNYKHKNLTEYELDNRVMSYYCGTIENHLLMLCYNKLAEKRILTKKKNVLLEYDGLCFLPAKPIEDVKVAITEVNNFIKKETGIPIEFIVKDYKEKYLHTDLIEKHLSRDDVSDDIDNSGYQHPIYDNKAYIKLRDEFNKTYFRVENPLMYGEIRPSGEVVFRDYVKFMRKLENIDTSIYRPFFNGNGMPQSFIDCWRRDPKMRSYSKVVCNPRYTDEEIYEDGEKVYNLFRGFYFDKLITGDIEKINIDTDKTKFFMLLKHLLKYEEDPEPFLYMINWIAHIIQRPYQKTMTNIIFYSDVKGVGKDTVARFIECLLGVVYCYKINNIDEFGADFNARFENKFFVRGEEICAKAKKYTQTIKTMTTRVRFSVQRKFIEPYDVNCFINMFFSTNNKFDMPTEDGDRRNTLFHMNENKMSSDVYSELDKELNCLYHTDPNMREIYTNKMKMLYKFFKEYPIDSKYKIGTGVSFETSYKKELMIEDKPAHYQYFYKNIDGYCNKIIPASEMFGIIKKYSAEARCKLNANSTVVGLFMNKLFKDELEYLKKRTSRGYEYNFKNLSEYDINKALINYDRDYYKYVNNLTEKEILEILENNDEEIE